MVIDRSMFGKVDTRLNYVKQADIAERYLVGSTTQFVTGMLIANATGTSGGVNRTNGAYDVSLFGAMSTDPYTILGASDPIWRQHQWRPVEALDQLRRQYHAIDMGRMARRDEYHPTTER